MQRLWKGWLAVGFIMALLAAVRSVPAAAPYTGSWAVTVLSNNQEITVWVLKIDEKDGKPEVKVIAGIAPPFKAAKVSNVSGDAKGLHFTLNARNTDFVISAYYPADKTKEVLGSVQINDNVEGIILKPTEQTEIDPMKAARPVAGLDDLKKAVEETDAKERRAAFKALFEKNAGKPIELIATQTLTKLEIAKGDSAADVKSAAERFITVAGNYGPAMQQIAAIQVARGLLQGKDPQAALLYARKAASLLGDSDPPTRKAAVLKTLAGALKKAGKTEEVKEVEAKLVKLEDQLDKEFIKNAVPFKPEPFGGRKGKSDRVAVVELFTGAQCPPCVSADIAFDAALKAYKPSEVVLLQYHLHIPRPDPLTNSDSEARAKYYGEEIRGTPTMLLDGKTTPPMGGLRQHGKERFDTLSSRINEALETEPGAQVKLTAERKGDKVDLVADVTDVKKPGDKVRLRFVVVEDVVRFPGRNGQRLHHHVVRAFPGGVEGFPLKEKTARQTASFSLADLHKSLKTYLEKAHFPEDEQPLKLENLKVGAFVQDDDSKAILQAAQADVPEEK